MGTKNRRRVLYVLIDFILLTFSFLFFAWLKPATVAKVLPQYLEPFIYFAFIWIVVSVVFDKYNFRHQLSWYKSLLPIFITNFTITGVLSIMVYFFNYMYLSRFIVFGTIGMTTFLELIMGGIHSYLLRVNKGSFLYEAADDVVEKKEPKARKESAERFRSDQKREVEDFVPPVAGLRVDMRPAIVEESGEAVYRFISNHIDTSDPENIVLSTTTRFNVQRIADNYYKNLVNLKRINDVRRINKFFEIVNTKLAVGGKFIIGVETYTLRKRRVLNKFWPGINYLVYTFDFIFKRIFPKFGPTKRIYFAFTQGRNRVLSKAEALGRLYSCGFEVVDEAFINNQLYVVARKKGEPAFDYHPTYGPLIRLRRFGKNGKLIGVYKMRTMHAYSEYLQAYVFEQNALQEGGKFKDDFRITTLGKLMRKLWIDELPMLINLLNGDLKIVGVRPLSRHYFGLYSKELQEERVKTKPGLIPPFYADMPKTLEEIQASEMKYLKAYQKSPFLTDFRYFWAAFYNILIKKARSN